MSHSDLHGHFRQMAVSQRCIRTVLVQERAGCFSQVVPYAVTTIAIYAQVPLYLFITPSIYCMYGNVYRVH